MIEWHYQTKAQFLYGIGMLWDLRNRGLIDYWSESLGVICIRVL